MNIFRSNTAYLPYIQLVMSCATILILLFDFSFNLAMLSLFVYMLIACFGISIGYHRYLTHRSFKLKRTWLKFPLFWVGCLAGTGSPLGWAAVHRSHHRFSDKVGDPHTPHLSGLKILVANYEYKINPRRVRDILSDKMHLFLHNYYFLLLLIWFSIALLIDVNIGAYCVIVPMTLAIWASTISNYLNHKFGYVSNITTDHSRNLWVTAYLTFGEGWHNNHHANPTDYQFGKKWWEFDWGAFIIRNILMNR